MADFTSLTVEAPRALFGGRQPGLGSAPKSPTWLHGSCPRQCAFNGRPSPVRAFLVAQLVQNASAMRETWLPSLGWEDSPGERHGNQLQYSCLENPMDKEEPGRLQSVGLQRVRRLKQPARTYTPPSLPHFHSRIYRFAVVSVLPLFVAMSLSEIRIIFSHWCY